MRRPSLLVLSGAALVALIAGLALVPRARGVGRLDADAIAPPPRAAREADELALPRALDASAPAEASAREDAGGARRVAASLDGVALDDAVSVRVVLAGDAREAERAAVWLVAGDAARKSWKRSRVELRARARAGERFDAGADGRVFVPRQQRDFVLAAETEDHFGWREVAAEEREVELVLEPAPALVVRVVGSDGAPAAGVPLVIRVAGERLPDVRTGEDGLARVEDLLAHAGGLAPDAPELAGATITVDAPRAEPIVARFDARSLAAPVEVELPPSGTLEVRLLTPEGEPLALRRGWVTLERLPSAAETLLAGDHWWSRQPWGTEIEGAVASIPAVGLGDRFLLRAGGDGLEGETQGPIAGPARPGERVVVDYVPARRPRIVEVRLLDAHGAPVLETKLLGRLEGPRGGRSIDRVETDALGRVRVAVPESWAPDAEWTLCLCPRRDPRLEARVRLPAELASGVTDAGDARLEPVSLLVSGVVRDEAGEPVRLATVHVEVVARSGGRIALPPARSRISGAFEAHGRADAGAALLVRASARGYAAREVDGIAPGDAEVEVVLRRNGRLIARVRCPEGMEPADVRARAIPRDAPGAGEVPLDRDRKASRASGEAVLEAELAPGRYDVRVVHGEVEVARVRDVVVRSGDAESRDARLDPLDLGAELRAVRVRLTSSAGAPLDGIFRWRARGAAEWAAQQTTGAGDLRIFTRADAVDVEVFARGHRAARLEGASGEHTLALEPGVPVRVSVPAAAGLDVEVPLALNCEQDGLTRWEMVTLGPDGDADLVCAPGAWTAYFAHGLALEERTTQTIEVLDVERPQVFVLDVLSRDVEDALRAVRPR